MSFPKEIRSQNCLGEKPNSAATEHEGARLYCKTACGFIEAKKLLIAATSWLL
jgi:hypothetical protein